MKISKFFLGLTALISLVFTTIILLSIPLWSDVQVFLGLKFPPIMLTANLFGFACLGGIAYRWYKPKVSKNWLHYLPLTLTSTVMVILLYVLLSELGVERALIWHNALEYFPIAVYILAAGILFITSPKRRSIRVAIAAIFIAAGLIWITLPWQLRIVNQPVALIRSEGVSLVWGTNMPAASRVTFGNSEALGSSAASSSNGLIDISDSLQQVSIPWSFTEDLYIRASSEGIKALFPTSAIQFRPEESQTVVIPFPEGNENISLIAFSDLHENVALVERFSTKIPWDNLDYAVYVGDLLNNTHDPQQVIEAILNLPTGDKSLPRVLVRGNHETRGPAARQLDDWLLPEGSEWYFTFTSGDVFFIVLDSGEDKSDDHEEYSGLVDFRAYHQKQADWLEQVFTFPEYRQSNHRIVFVHHPPFDDPTTEFSQVVDQLKTQPQIDLVISGHIHNSSLWFPEDTGLPFPVATCGGSSSENIAAVIVYEKSEGLQVDLLDVDGNVFQQALFP
jgi:predicted MPP superfamily phosphohydrolase